MFRRFLIIAMLAWLSVAGVGFASAQEVLTLEEALQVAHRQNPDFQATRAQLGLQDAEVTLASTRDNPLFLSDNGIAEKTYRVGLQYTFNMSGLRHKRMALAKAQRDVVAAQIGTALLDLQTEVRKAYTQLYITQQQEVLARDLLLTTEKLITTLRQKTGDPDISTEILDAEIESMQIGDDLQEARFENRQALHKLNALLGEPLSRQWVLVAPNQAPASLQAAPQQEGVPTETLLTEAVATDLEQMALANRPELKEGQESLKAAQQALQLARAARVPVLNLVAGPDLVYTDTLDTSAFIIGVFQIPIFDRQQGPIQQAIARRIQIQQDQRALRNRIALEVANAEAAYFIQRERILNYETQVLPRVQRLEEIAQQQAANGTASSNMMLAAHKAYLNAYLSYLENLAAFQNSISDLERAIGLPLQAFSSPGEDLAP